MSDYEIITVNWQPKQTAIWLHYVEKNCPDAKVYTIPDDKPVPWCWSGGKINCFAWPFETKRVIYLDTDTLVTRDLGFVFDEMQGACIGLSSEIEIFKFHITMRPQVEKFGKRGYEYNWPPCAFSSGMMVLKGYDATALYAGWLNTMQWPPFLELFGKHTLADEIGLGLWLAHDLESADDVWHIPVEVHGNVLGGKTHFGKVETPAVIHYHKEARLRKAGLGKWLDM